MRKSPDVGTAHISPKRLFTTASVKGRRGYLNSQRPYEIIRTVLYFGVSAALFAAGVAATHTRNNLLTYVAILGCLPASKSLVEAVMYCRYGSLPEDAAAVIEPVSVGLDCLYDMVFTTREVNYPVLHMAVQGDSVVGLMYPRGSKCTEAACKQHLESTLGVDGFKDISVRIFTDIDKYVTRLGSMQGGTRAKNTDAVIASLKSVAL